MKTLSGAEVGLVIQSFSSCARGGGGALRLGDGQGVDVSVRTHVVLGHAVGELGRVAAARQPPDPAHRRALLHQLQERARQEEDVLEHEHGHGHLVHVHLEAAHHQQGGVHQQARGEARPQPPAAQLGRGQLVEPDHRHGQGHEVHGDHGVLEVGGGDLPPQQHLQQREAVQQVQAGAQEAAVGVVPRRPVQVLDDGVDEAEEQRRGEQHHDLEPGGPARHLQRHQVQDGGLQDEHHLGGARDHVDEPGQVGVGELAEVAAEDGALLVEAAGPLPLAPRVLHEEDAPARDHHQVRGDPRAPVQVGEDDEVEVQDAALEDEQQEAERLVQQAPLGPVRQQRGALHELPRCHDAGGGRGRGDQGLDAASLLRVDAAAGGLGVPPPAQVAGFRRGWVGGVARFVLEIVGLQVVVASFRDHCICAVASFSPPLLPPRCFPRWRQGHAQRQARTGAAGMD